MAHAEHPLIAAHRSHAAAHLIGQRLKSEFTPSEEQDEYSQLTSTVVTETRRINDIIQQFLQFARPSELVKTETDISKLIADGKEVLIARYGQPVAKLVPIKPLQEDRVPGTAKGKIKMKENFFDPLPDDILGEFYN